VGGISSQYSGRGGHGIENEVRRLRELRHNPSFHVTTRVTAYVANSKSGARLVVVCGVRTLQRPGTGEQ